MAAGLAGVVGVLVALGEGDEPPPAPDLVLVVVDPGVLVEPALGAVEGLGLGPDSGPVVGVEPGPEPAAGS